MSSADPIVSNSASSVNTDLDVRSSVNTGGKLIQHFRLDIGSGTAEAQMVAGQTTMALSPCVNIASNQSAIPVTVASLPLGTGAATEATLSALNSKVTTCNTGAVTISSSLPAGTSAIGKLAANDGVDVGDVTINNGSGASAVNIQDGGNSITVDSATASNFNAQVVGELAHDAIDSGNPLKVGGKAIDADPSQGAGSQAPAEVAENDRVNAWLDLSGRVMTGVEGQYTTLTNISTTYNNITTTATSGAVECWMYREGLFAFSCTKANTPTELLFELQFSADGTNYFTYQNDFWGTFIYDDVLAGLSPSHCFSFPVRAMYARMKVTATGTTASATFTISNAAFYLRN